mgnify:CR=1 FL=1
MPTDVLYGKTLRKSFARTPEIMDMPNLLEIQKSSYKWFLETGLKEVFRDVDTVTDYTGNLELSFVDYSMNDAPKYSEEECKARDATYAAPLKVSVRCISGSSRMSFLIFSRSSVLFGLSCVSPSSAVLKTRMVRLSRLRICDSFTVWGFMGSVTSFPALAW